jgi:hypothetical protein
VNKVSMSLWFLCNIVLEVLTSVVRYEGEKQTHLMLETYVTFFICKTQKYIHRIFYELWSMDTVIDILLKNWNVSWALLGVMIVVPSAKYA